jgi:hypothetical protein
MYKKPQELKEFGLELGVVTGFRVARSGLWTIYERFARAYRGVCRYRPATPSPGSEDEG